MNAEFGWFYKMFIDPLLVSGRKKIVAEIKPHQKILDVACGTGALVFDLAKVAKKVVGVDLSESMIKTAKKEQLKQTAKNVEFIVADATNLKSFSNNEFDVVTLSMALHQFNPDLHSPILHELKRVAKIIIVVDYSIPLPKNIFGYSAKFIEFLAGKEHNRNFRKYYKRGGLKYIMRKNGIKIDQSIYFSNRVFQLIKCSKE